MSCCCLFRGITLNVRTVRLLCFSVSAEWWCSVAPEVNKEIAALCATCDMKPTASGISLTNLISGQDYDYSPWSSYIHLILRDNNINCFYMRYHCLAGTCTLIGANQFCHQWWSANSVTLRFQPIAFLWIIQLYTWCSNGPSCSYCMWAADFR